MTTIETKMCWIGSDQGKRCRNSVCVVVTVSALYALTLLSMAQAAVFNVPAEDVAALIDAIETANGNGEDDTINLAEGSYDLMEVDNSTNGANGLPSITSNIIISGVGAAPAGEGCRGSDDCTSIAGGFGIDPFRIIHVAETGVLKLDHITIIGGTSDSGGGGLFNAGTMIVTNSTISNNMTSSDGAGIFNAGALTVSNSTISNNNPDRSGASGRGGGGIFNAGTLSVTNSSISGNYHDLHGGGINNSTSGTATVTNSTIYGNTGEGGGGISNDGIMTVISSTISNNLNDQSDIPGGGIENGGTLRFTHSIIAGNFRQGQEGDRPFPPPTHEDCRNVTDVDLTSLGHNIVGKDTGCPSNGPGDLTVEPDDVFTTVLNSLLQDNGGPTPTQALLRDSFNPAIDAGAQVCTDANDIPLQQDQRGEPRPQGRACDIGAFEVADPPPPVMCRGRLATIVGTPGDDMLIGTVGADVIHGGDGDDVIAGLDGNDIICGGRGNDIIFGGDGRDRQFGNRGNDELDGGDGQDFCGGGAGRDTAANCESVVNVP